jgi:hypothetical protein
MINQSCFVLLSIVTTLSIAPLIPIYMKQYDKGLSQVALLVVLSSGFANILADLRPSDRGYHYRFGLCELHHSLC